MDLGKSDLLLIDEIAFKLNSGRIEVSSSAIVLAKKILADAHEKHIVCGRKPSTLAVSALYIACRMDGKRVRQMDIANASGVTQITIIKFHKFLMSRMGLVFPSDEPRKRYAELCAMKVRLEKVLRMIDDCSERLKDLEAERDSLSTEIKILAELTKKEAV